MRDRPEATRLGFRTVLSRQGRALDAAARGQAALFARAPAAVRGLLDELREVHERIVWLTLRAPPAGDSEDRAAELGALHVRAGAIGRRMHAELGALDRAAVEGLEGGVAALAKRLQPGQALVNYFLFRPFHPARISGRHDPPRYAAYVLTADGHLDHVDLGPASAIDELIEAWRAALVARHRGADELAVRLHRHVFQPVVGMLGEARDLHVVADAELNLIPFEALRAEAARPLLYQWRFTMLTSARDLATLDARPSAGGGVIVYAEPDFGEPDFDEDDPPPGLLGQTVFTPLPGTGAEAVGVLDAFPAATLRTGRKASGASLRALARPRVLHIASHGFFLGAGASRRDLAARGLARVAADGPSLLPPVDPSVSALVRSGLAFAGANRGDLGSVVAGLELAGLDLRGTRLVTLSACESGVGEPAVGDGVHGIRRALYLAGSETQVLSLWNVDDGATAVLMRRFYANLAAGLARGEALRAAKVELAASPRYAHPYYWAAFVLGGSQHALDGAPAEPPKDRTPVSPPPPTPTPPGCHCAGGEEPRAAPVLALILIARRRRPRIEGSCAGRTTCSLPSTTACCRRGRCWSRRAGGASLATEGGC
jgi:CHAT domain-containing protein